MGNQEDRIVEKKKDWLSKSQIQMFLDCPFKWKLCYIDDMKSISSPQQNRGKEIHSKIETFYKDVTLKETKESKIPTIIPKDNKDIEEFIKFENTRIKDCTDEKGEFKLDLFKPLYQELWIEDEELLLRGFIDAVFLDKKGIIIIDWKTGKYRPYALDKYRFELAVYKELFERKFKKKVAMWGILFLDAGKLFLEDVDEKHVNKMYNIVNKVRQEMKDGDYKKKYSYFCKTCEFKHLCKK